MNRSQTAGGLEYTCDRIVSDMAAYFSRSTRSDFT